MDVDPSVCPIWLPHATAAGLLLWAQWAGDIDQLLHGWSFAAASQQRRVVAECGQCHFVS